MGNLSTPANGSTAEAAAAAGVRAETSGNEYAAVLAALALREDDLVVKDDYRGAVVEGVVENTGRERIEHVEVRTRVYDEGGAHLGRYLDSTDDLAAGTTWRFGAVVLEDPGDIGAYDVAVLGVLG